jgi:DNA-binding FadR family transcriptional regulator
MLYLFNLIDLINTINVKIDAMILNDKSAPENLSVFLRYLVAMDKSQAEQLPALAELSGQLGISIASLREQLEVGRALGLVEVRPRTGVRRLPYSFRQTLRQSLAYALAVEPESFQHFSDLRNHIETAYWEQAARKLLPEDLIMLQNLIDRAETKLHGHPIQIPHNEHRELHLTIYRQLGNPFVTGVLEAYWEMYEEIGLNVYTDYDYLERVWQYHQSIVDAICEGDFHKGYHLLVDHMHLLSERPASVPVSRPASLQNESTKE